MYCLYIPVLHVYVWMVCIVCIVCICMYLHVLYVLEILYVCVCIVCICLYISKRFFRYIHIHAHTYIHTIHTKYRYVANVCMCMYFRVNTYIIQTAGFTYRQIQTCRFPDVAASALLGVSVVVPARALGADRGRARCLDVFARLSGSLVAPRGFGCAGLRPPFLCSEQCAGQGGPRAVGFIAGRSRWA